MARTVECTADIRAGRLRKAIQFAEAAEAVSTLADDAGDVADAYVTLLVHAGIAAADVLCCARLGIHSQGEGHRESIDLLEKVDKKLASDLATLLGVKTKAGYSARPVSAVDRTKASRACDRLLQAALDLP